MFKKQGKKVEVNAISEELKPSQPQLDHGGGGGVAGRAGGAG